jgi:alkyl sulfatase BDS1-like metallo-beta-lactamase superfamily hydrolase
MNKAQESSMTRFSTLNHPILEMIGWLPEKPAERVNDHILMSRGTSNAYVVTSDAGDVVINTGMPVEGARHRERFETLLGRPLRVARILYTQSHADHIGGWEVFADEGAETIVQREFTRTLRERNLLAPFFFPRIVRVLSAMLNPSNTTAAAQVPREPEKLTSFADRLEFTQGGRRFELISTPSGETLDSVSIWLPEEKTLFTGNLMGAIYGAMPNFYTARGDRQRSVPGFMADIARLIALEPELLITGHEAPIAGAARIRADLTKLLDAVTYVHDETVKGMNAQRRLSDLMREIVLPDHLTMKPGRGPISWYVRSVWEEYAGWFHHESTTELFAVPPGAIWPELAEAAGGASALATRAKIHVAAGRPLEALHFLEIALAAEPGNRDALQTNLDALEQLADQNGGLIFDELGWLEGQIKATKEAIRR